MTAYVQPYSSSLLDWQRQVSLAITQLSNAEPNTPETFGAYGNDSSVDNSVALNKFFSAAASGLPVVFPDKTYYFKSALTCAAANDLEIVGRGTLIYNGASTTIDLLTIGASSPQSIRMRLSGLRIASNTTMTAGTTLHLVKVYRSAIEDLILDGQDGNGNLWNGLWFDGCDVETVEDFQIAAANDCLRFNDGSDLFLDNGKICPADVVLGGARNSACGIRMGGGFGGCQFGNVDVIGCNINMTVDNTLSVTANREINFSAGAALDSSKTGANLYLNETSGAPVYVNSAGGWFGSAHTHNIEIANSSSAYNIVFAGGRIYNAQTGDGVRNNAPNAIISLTGVQIANNAGYGVNDATTSISVKTSLCQFSGNGSGDLAGTVMDPVRPTIVSITNGSNAAIQGSCGLLVVTDADGGASTGVYVLGSGGAALVSQTGSPTWVAPTTTPGAGQLSVAYSSGFKVYNNSGSTARIQAVLIRSV